MKNVARLQQPVQWYEGMLLMPQHFQYAQQRHDQLLRYHLQQLMPNGYGLIDLDYDASALVAGRLIIQRLEAVLPDGLLVVIGGQGETLSLDLVQAGFNPGETRTLYIAVAEERGFGETSQRYISVESPEINDMNTGDNAIRTPVLHPNNQLLAASEPPVGYVALPLLQVTREGQGFRKINFIPPLMRVTGTSVLHQRLEGLASAMRDKIMFLSDQLRGTHKDVMSREAEQIVCALTQALIPYEALLRSNAATPFALYQELARAAGIILSLHPNLVPPVLPAYDHMQMDACFTEVMTIIFDVLSKIQEGYIIVGFSQDQRLFELDLRPEWLRNRMVIGAKVPASMDEKDLVSWMEGAVICSQRHISSVRDRRILGAARKVISEDVEMNLLPAKDVVFFSITGDANFIEEDQPLCIFNVADSPENRPVEIVLYVPKTKA
ncbi:MAG: type VI secretion system baseplate subunit TssK [Holosporales bacterium]